MAKHAPAPSSGVGNLGLAAVHATDRVPLARATEQVGEVRARLVGREFDTVEDVAVLDGESLAGLVPLERLLMSEPDRAVREIMDPDPPAIGPSIAEDQAAKRMLERHESSLAVVDEEGRFQGLIPPHRMLSVLFAAHHRDLARLGGYLAGSISARGAAEEPVPQRLWHRLPWLIVGVIGAMALAVIVGGFESQLEANVLVAFFIPAIVYMAGAVGTQTEILLIRALSAGVTIRSVAARELGTGVFIGLVIGVAFLAFAWIGWDDGRVAAAVAVSLVVSCLLATAVAVALPAVFQRLGVDPAFGSGPIATVIQDLLSVVVYLVLVTVIVL